MYTFLTVLHVVVCIFLMLVVLLQAGRGGGIGLAFGGSGGSQSVFGSSGGANFLTKMTAICAIIFFANSLALAYLSSQSDSRRLQRIAEHKAQQKKSEEAASAKLLQDIEKQRADKAKAEENKSENPPAEGAGEESAGGGAAAPAGEPSRGTEGKGPAMPSLKLTPPGKIPADGKGATDFKLDPGVKPPAEKPVKPAAEKPAKPVPEKKVKRPAKPAADEAPAAEKPATDKAPAEGEPAAE